MATITLYGIPNCDTVKKARAWLQDRGVAYRFHDFRKEGVPADRLAAWMQSPDGERLINRQGTTWRKLDPAVQQAVTTAAGARALLMEQPSVIKRPVVDWPDGSTTVGFDPVGWALRTDR
ncbi:MAG: arsenate reductase [Ramlibacter sp.]|jgi:Spx/MgsR family transcriptional regulator|nr:arsenate reductase [Ramlibacter sp.]